MKVPIIDRETGKKIEKDISEMNNSEMADLAYQQFEHAYVNHLITLHPLPGYESVVTHMDYPNGEVRLTFAILDENRELMSIAIINSAEPYEDLPCFAITYASNPKHSNKGYAKKIAKAAIDDLRKGMKRHNINEIYVEATIDKDNHASDRVAKDVLEDRYEEDKIIRYMRKFS